MAVQKRRQSKARRDSRRSHWLKLDAPNASPCPHCGEPRMPHRVCASCGKYGPADAAREVFTAKGSSSTQS